MLYKIVVFAAHDRFRITDQRSAFLAPGKACQKIYFPIKQHLVKVTESAVNIFVFPPGILGDLLIVFICISGLYGIGLCTFLEDLILIVTYPDRFALGIGRH